MQVKELSFVLCFRLWLSWDRNGLRAFQYHSGWKMETLRQDAEKRARPPSHRTGAGKRFYGHLRAFHGLPSRERGQDWNELGRYGGGRLTASGFRSGAARNNLYNSIHTPCIPFNGLSCLCLINEGVCLAFLAAKFIHD